MGVVKWFHAEVAGSDQLAPLLQLPGDTESDSAIVRIVSSQRHNLSGPIGPRIYSGLAGENCGEFESDDPGEFRQMFVTALRDAEFASMMISVKGQYEFLNCLIGDLNITFYEGGVGADADQALATFEQDMKDLLTSLGVNCVSAESYLA